MTSTGGSGSVVLATGGFDHTIRLWEAPTGLCHRTLPFPDSPINALTISSDKQILLVAGNPVLRLFSLTASHAPINQSNNQVNSSPHLASFEGHTGAVTGCGFQKSGRWLYSSSEDGTIKVWDTRVSATCQRSYSHGCPVTDVALHPNQGELIACDTEGNIKVWDLTNNQCVKTFTSETSVPLTKLCIANDASQVMAASYKGQVFGWKLGNQSNNQSNPQSSNPASQTPYVVIDAHQKYCLKALLSPDCKWLATASADQTIKIWSTDRHQYASHRTLTGHTQWVWDVAFSADSAYLVSASSDKVAKLWDREAGECILEYKGHQKPITAIALNDAS